MSSQNHDLVRENRKLASQLKGERLIQSKNQQEISDLKETLGERNSKLKLQEQRIETFEDNLKALMNIVLCQKGVEPTFFNLRNEVEHLKMSYITQKEELEILQASNFPMND